MSLLLQTPRFGLVHTPMVATTVQHYRGWPAMTAAEAAERVVRALEDRPVAWNVAAGRAGDVLDLLTPRLADYVTHRLDRAGGRATAEVGPHVPSP